MDAIHVKWTKPDAGKIMEDFEILTMILSALKWREKNGKIALITDSTGEAYFKKNGLDMLWDNGIESMLDTIPDEINPQTFWAAGKIFALQKCKPDIAVLDMDFIVWEELDFGKIKDVSVIHREEICDAVYPDKDYFKMKDGYEFKNMNWEAAPCNTAFYVIKNRDFLEYYTSESIRFMKNALYTDDKLKYMVFAEQRLFGMCAEKMEIKLDFFSDLNALFENEHCFTHIWGMKQQMRENPLIKNAFCKKCVLRILKDYPYMRDVMKNIGILSCYMSD